MHKTGLVLAVKYQDKICREIDGTVILPFGSTYTILIKNLSNTRASCDVFIDGKNIASDGTFIINPKEEVELKRFVTDVNAETGNSFKFIERTETIEKFRGVKIEDGLIHVDFKFEAVKYTNPRDVLRGIPQQWSSSDYTFCDSNNLVNCSCEYTKSNLSDVGITVPGALVDQKFEIVAPLVNVESSGFMTLKLQGKVDKKRVSKPLLVKTKPKCITCGRTNSSASKFCSECGTSLQIM